MATAEGIVSRFAKLVNAQVVERLTDQGSLAVDQVKESGDEMTRGGFRYHLNANAATGVAPVQAIPTTAAQWLLYNPAVAANPTAFIDRLSVVNVSGTAGAGAVLYAAICKATQVPATAPTTSAAGVKVINASPTTIKSSVLLCASGQVLQNVTASDWHAVAQMIFSETVVGQALIDSTWDIRGKFVIPPGCGLALAVVSPTGTSPLFAPSVSYREYQSDLE